MPKLPQEPLSSSAPWLDRHPLRESDRGRRLFVRLIAWAIVFWLPIVHAADLVAGIWAPHRLLLFGAGIAVALASLRLVGQGRLRASAVLLTVGLFPWLALTNVVAGGIAAPGAPGYMILVVLAGWIFGWRAMLAMLALSLAWIFGLATLESMHLLPDPVLFPPLRRALVYAIIFSLIALMAYLIIREADARVAALAAVRMALEEKMMALAASEARFGAAFHDSPAPLMIVGAEDDRYLDVNRAWLELTRRERAQVIGHTSLEFGLWVDPATREELAAAVLRDGSVDRFEARLRRGDGEERACQISSRSFEHEGLRLRLASILDVNDQRQAQQQIEDMNSILERMVSRRTRELSGANAELHQALQTLRSAQDQLLQSEKMAALGRLVAGVAHELNTPIGNGLLVASSLREKTEHFATEVSSGLRRSALENYLAESREGAEMLTRSLHRAADLVASFKQVAADQTSSQRRSFDLQNLIEEVLLTYRPMLKTTSIKASSDVAPGILLDSYPGPLGQVIGNLLANAVLHGYEERESGTVTVSARVDGGSLVEITVCDDGRGIPEANLRRVFDPFFTTRLGRGGTGLGLAICRSIVTDTLGGTIRISSQPGDGTRVVASIPLTAPTGASEPVHRHVA